MIRSRRALVPVADLPRLRADGWREVYRTGGGWRVDGEAAVELTDPAALHAPRRDPIFS